MRTLRLRVRGHRSSYRADITVFVQRQAYLRSPSSAKILVVAMRPFLRYLEYKGLTIFSLDKAVPAVVGWALSSLPKHLAAEQVQKVLDHCDRATKAGRRDYAILLLLARVGCAREKSSR
jgi:integrase/recombinase XerD